MTKVFYIFIIFFLSITNCRHNKIIPEPQQEPQPQAQPEPEKNETILPLTFKTDEESLKKTINELRADLEKLGNSRLDQYKRSEYLENILDLHWRIKGHEHSKKYPPYFMTEVKGKKFYLSKRYYRKENDDHEYIMMYTKDKDNEVVSRLLYHSNSDGSWRVTPFFKKDGTLSKGAEVHYTQETKLLIPIMNKIETISESAGINKDIREDFTLPEEGFKQIWDKMDYSIANYYFQRDVTPKDPKDQNLLENLKILRECQPGDCFDIYAIYEKARYTKKATLYDKPAMEVLIKRTNEALVKLGNFVPSFNEKPISFYTFQHSFLKETKVEIYEGKLGERSVHWHMAFAKEKEKYRVWIDRISYPDSDISSYGTKSEFLDSGILTNKPIEYKKQLNGITAKEYVEKYNDKYSYITNILEKLSPIATFMELKGFDK